MFDESQQRCIDDPRLPYYCLAGAGAGKTKTLLGKAAQWSREARGRRITILCFNKGIQTEIAEKIKRQGLIGVEARTLHSLGLSFIREAFRDFRASPPKDSRPFYFGTYRDAQHQALYRDYPGLLQEFLDYFGAPGWPEVLRTIHGPLAELTFTLKALLGASKHPDFDPTKHVGWPLVIQALDQILAATGLGDPAALRLHAVDLAHDLVGKTLANKAAPKVHNYIKRQLYHDHFIDYAHACFMECTYGGDLFGRFADRELDGFVPRVPRFVALALNLTPLDLIEIDYRSYSQLMLPPELGRVVRDALVFRMREFQELDFQSQITVGAYAATLTRPSLWGLMIDESQDLDLYQWYLTSQAFPRLMATPRLWYVGDEMQCQPGTTQVRLGDGREVDLADLEVGAKIATHSRRTSMFTTSTVLAKAARPYRGPMYEVTAGGRTTRCTPEHLWNVLDHQAVVTVETRDLLPGMAVPLFTDLNEVVIWEPITLKTEPFDGLVYSIEVDKTQTYIADGLATHNCIYRWRGASARRFIAQTTSSPHGALAYSYRCPAVIVDKANALCRQFTNVAVQGRPYISRATAQPGHYMALPELTDPFDFERFAGQHGVPMADTVILARTNSDLMTWQLWAIFQRIEISELLLTGLPVEPEKLRELIAMSLLYDHRSPIGQARQIILERRDPQYLDDLIESLEQATTRNQAAKVVFSYWRAEPGLDLDDLPDDETRAGIAAVMTVLDWCSQDKGGIVSNFRRLAAGPLRINKGHGLTLSTIHRYKGREKPFVFITSKVWARLWNMQKTPEGLDEELALMYVAVTRASRAAFCCGVDLPGPLVEDLPPIVAQETAKRLEQPRLRLGAVETASFNVW